MLCMAIGAVLCPLGRRLCTIQGCVLIQVLAPRWCSALRGNRSCARSALWDDDSVLPRAGAPHCREALHWEEAPCSKGELQRQNALLFSNLRSSSSSRSYPVQRMSGTLQFAAVSKDKDVIQFGQTRTRTSPPRTRMLPNVSKRRSALRGPYNGGAHLRSRIPGATL